MIMRYYIRPTDVGRHVPNSFYEKFDHRKIYANRKYAYYVQQDASRSYYDGELYVCRKVYRYPLCLLGTYNFGCPSCGELLAEIYDLCEQAR